MTDILGMSDEDFLNQGETLLDDVDASTDESFGAEEEITSGSNGEELSTEDEADESYEEQSAPGEQEAPEEAEEGELDESHAEDGEGAPEASDEASEVDNLQKVLQPFRANGKDVQVKNADEAITLMQLGANYTKKMQELSPKLKALKALEKNELLDEGKLNYLIDLSKNDPKAIAKLIKDAEYEPAGFEDEDNVEYTPTNHQVSDNAMQLEQVLESLESTPTYDKCIDLVGNQWDEQSRGLLTQEPDNIRMLNEQMQSGIFDKVNTEVERVKMFGGLSGMSDFEAYKTVGAQMMQAGTLTPAVQKPVASTVVKPLDKALSKQRQAATNSKKSAAKVATPKKSYLDMSDEDFLKLNNIQL